MWLPRRKGRERDGWGVGVSRYKLFHLGWISNEVLLWSTRNCIQPLGIDHEGRSYKKGNVCVYD